MTIEALDFTCVSNLPNFLPERDLTFFGGCGCSGLELPPTLNVSDPDTIRPYFSGMITFYGNVLECIATEPTIIVTKCTPLVPGIINLLCTFSNLCCEENVCDSLTVEQDVNNVLILQAFINTLLECANL